MKGKPEPEVYAVRCECLNEWETLSQQQQIDVFYGDESGVSLFPCIPYGWQFPGERVTTPSTHGGQLNCFALLARDNDCFFRTTEASITADWLGEQLDIFSVSLKRLTVVVLDNAPLHRKMVKDRGSLWEERGLFIGFLPPYSPQLNIVETLWKKLKYEWLQAKDYACKETLHAAVRQALGEVGKSLRIAFKPFTSPAYSLTQI